MYMNGRGPMSPMGSPMRRRPMGFRPMGGPMYRRPMGFRPMGMRHRPIGFFPMGSLLILPALMLGGWIAVIVVGGALSLIGALIGGIFSGIGSIASGIFSGRGFVLGIVIGLAAYCYFRSRKARNASVNETEE